MSQIKDGYKLELRAPDNSLITSASLDGLSEDEILYNKDLQVEIMEDIIGHLSDEDWEEESEE